MNQKNSAVELLNKYVVLEVKMPNSGDRYYNNNHYYNGKLIRVDEENYVVKDIELGVTPFPRKSVTNIREMQKIDMIELSRKAPRIAMKLKFQQADEKIIQNFEETVNEIKKKLGW